MPLNVAEVAAIINVGLIILQLTYPLLVSFVSAGILKIKVNAATWSVFGRLINDSHWPWILGTDTSSSRKVDKRVQGMSYFSSFATVLLAVAAVVTPLGLHTTLNLCERKDTTFVYAPDNSPIGKATPWRSGYKYNRYCSSGFTGADNCPGNNNGWNYTFYANGSSTFAPEPGFPNPWLSTAIAHNITEIFSSGTHNSTIASIFDIEYRSYVNVGNKTKPSADEDPRGRAWIDQGRPRTQGRFYYYQQFIPHSRIEVIEGLIVSTTDSPSIGFRNHTVPPASDHGYTWTEEILWLEPETACTDLNVTLDYTTPIADQFLGSSFDTNIRITNRGGLTDLPTSTPPLHLERSLDDPKLLTRSWNAATLINLGIADFLHITNGTNRDTKAFHLKQRPDCHFVESPNPTRIDFGFFGQGYPKSDYWLPRLPGPLNCLGSFKHGEGKGRSYNIIDLVSGYHASTRQSISALGFQGGILLGAGVQVDPSGKPLDVPTAAFLRPGANYSHSLFSCVSALKASVKTVRFRSKGPALLSNLVVEDVYSSNTTKPIWGFEDPGRFIYDLDAMWGLVSADRIGLPGVSTSFRSQFYLPAGKSSFDLSRGLSWMDAIAGASAPTTALAQIYFQGTGGIWDDFFPDYSGYRDWALYLRWEQLSRHASTAGRVFDLVWTDLMANMVLGTKSTLSGHPGSQVNRPAELFVETVAYNWQYSAIALVVFATYAALFFWSTILYAIKACDVTMLRFLLNQSAAGRSVTVERFDGTNSVDHAKTSEWARHRGNKIVLVSKNDVRKPTAPPKERQTVRPKETG